MRRTAAITVVLAALLGVTVAGGLLAMGVHTWQEVPPPPVATDAPDGGGRLAR